MRTRSQEQPGYKSNQVTRADDGPLWTESPSLATERGQREWAQTQPSEISVQASRLQSAALLGFNKSLLPSGPGLISHRLVTPSGSWARTSGRRSPDHTSQAPGRPLWRLRFHRCHHLPSGVGGAAILRLGLPQPPATALASLGAHLPPPHTPRPRPAPPPPAAKGSDAALPTAHAQYTGRAEARGAGRGGPGRAR